MPMQTIPQQRVIEKLDEHMAQKALARVLVIGGESKRGEKPPHLKDDPVGKLILDLAGIYPHDMVGAGLIHARDDLAPFIGIKRRLYLVAVMIRVLHADDRLDFPKFAQQLFNLVLLESKLFGIA